MAGRAAARPGAPAVPTITGGRRGSRGWSVWRCGASMPARAWSARAQGARVLWRVEVDEALASDAVEGPSEDDMEDLFVRLHEHGYLDEQELAHARLLLVRVLEQDAERQSPAGCSAGRRAARLPVRGWRRADRAAVLAVRHRGGERPGG